MKYLIFLFPILTNAQALIQVDVGLTPGSNTKVYGEKTGRITHGTEMAKAAESEMGDSKIDIYQVGCDFSIKDYTCGSLVAPIRRAINLHPKVISMSLSGRFRDSLEEKLIAEAQKKGILLILASGNDNNKTPGYPAAYGGICSLSVGTTKGNKITKYSNYADIYLEQVAFEMGTSYSTARMGVLAVQYWQGNCQKTKKFLKEKYGKNIQ